MTSRVCVCVPPLLSWGVEADEEWHRCRHRWRCGQRLPASNLFCASFSNLFRTIGSCCVSLQSSVVCAQCPSWSDEWAKSQSRSIRETAFFFFFFQFQFMVFAVFRLSIFNYDIASCCFPISIKLYPLTHRSIATDWVRVQYCYRTFRAFNGKCRVRCLGVAFAFAMDI